jgi:hypothetical protein
VCGENSTVYLYSFNLIRSNEFLHDPAATLCFATGRYPIRIPARPPWFFSKQANAKAVPQIRPHQLHPFKFVAHKHPSTRLRSPVNKLQSLNDPRITSRTSFAKLRPSTCSLTSRTTASSQPITQLRSVIPPFKSSRLAHPHCLSKCIFVRGFRTKIWRSSTNRNLINIRRTRETVLAAPRAQYVSSSLLRLDLAPTTAVPRAEAHAEWARCIVRMLITCKWGTRIRATGA